MIGRRSKAIVCKEAGFTLVEVLVALALFGLLTTLLFSNVRFGLRAWQTAGSHDELVARSMASQDTLRRLIGNAYPMLVSSSGTNPSIDFEGTKEEMTFLGDAPVVTGGAGRFRFKLFAERKDDRTGLVVKAIPELANRQNTSMTTTSLLLTDIDRVEFSYSGSEAKGQIEWRDSWTKQSELPKLVRVRVVFRSADALRWPDLVVAPRIGADVGCVYDTITKRCRGR